MHQVGFKPRIPAFEMLDAACVSIEESKRGQMHLLFYIFIPNSSFFGYCNEEGKKIDIFSKRSHGWCKDRKN